MTPLSETVLEAARVALAASAPGLEDCREHARAVAVAVLATLGGTKGKPGLVQFTSKLSQQLCAMADELDDEGR